MATLLLAPTPTLAHVGSPDIYAEGQAGPYKLLITVRPPLVIPGVAEIEVRTTGPVSGIDIAPIPLVGEASKHPPVADAMKVSAQDKQFFTGALWIMASGSWQVRFMVDGSQGTGVLSIPVPATSSSTKGMDAGLGLILGAMGLLLVAGVVGIVGAAARDAQLPPGATAEPAGRKRAVVAMAVTLALMAGAVWFGKVWWQGEADDYARYVYKPLTLQTDLAANASSAPTLKLRIVDPGWLKTRKIDDFVLDHDHLMHLYLIRQPDLDLVYHLHPEQVAPGEFTLALPSLPAADYKLYADVVHATGFPETLVASLSLPKIDGRPLSGDDARGTAASVGSLKCEGNPSAPNRAAVTFADGYTMTWRHPAYFAAKTPEVFEFTLTDPQGKPPADMALYMGMVGHAAFVKDDGTVFAHVHPSGTVSMAALMMAAAQNQPDPASAVKATAMASMPDMESDEEGDDSGQAKKPSPASPAPASLSSMEGRMAMAPSGVPNTVGFPYGFPTPGAYRIFVQMKHGETIETGAFDACALAPAKY
jgi:hypothetical protein